MNTGWRIWFAFLIIAALYGFVMIGDAQRAADVNAAGAMSASQQTVNGLWQVADVAAIIVYELIVAVVAIASLGLFLISRDDPPVEVEQPTRRGAHAEGAAPGERDRG